MDKLQEYAWEPIQVAEVGTPEYPCTDEVRHYIALSNGQIGVPPDRQATILAVAPGEPSGCSINLFY